jgi:hypothetical protein
MSDNNLTGKDEALLILEYLENEHMSKTFLNFLDESKHLHQLRSRLYANYENNINNNNNENDSEVQEFQTFFNLSKQIVSQINNNEENEQLTYLSNKNSNDLFFDEDFLNDLISQTPPMDYQYDLPDTPIPSIINHDNEDFKSIEQLFATQHHTPSHQIIQILPSDTPSRLTSTIPYTKCIVVTQDFLQSMYNQSSTITNNNNINYIHRPKRRRRRRLKIGKENYYQQRKIMPRTSADHH